MKEKKCRMSVIVPVYNLKLHLNACLDSLVAQSINKQELEVLLIDDGSTDNSLSICHSYAEKYTFFKVFARKNCGVSNTRNFGIQKASGDYITYLDGDDILTPDTLMTLANFFDKHVDDVDLITYKIVPIRNGKRLNVHFRYHFLNETGVYDLNDEDNWYITQTTINICVRNRGKDNILFDENLKYHEDQKYCFENLTDKLKIGYCDGPEYIYNKVESSVTSTKRFAYYIFESTTALWENLFARYPDRVPPYLQALFINDVNWKSVSDTLLPHHYNKEKFDHSVDRICELISRVDDAVIFNHPRINFYQKYYLLDLKKNNDITFSCKTDKIELYNYGETIFESDNINVVFNEYKVLGDTLHIDAFLKSPIFNYIGKPKLTLVTEGNNNEVRRELELTQSSKSYYHSKTKNANFWRFTLKINIKQDITFRFETEIDSITFCPTAYFMKQTSFWMRGKKRVFFRDGRKFSYNEKFGKFRISKANALSHLKVGIKHFFKCVCIDFKLPVYRWFTVIPPKQKTWLYFDRNGVFDNAYYQFKHDFSKNDGINRLYVLNDCDRDQLNKRFDPQERKNIIFFRSLKHKYYYLNCDKLITSFSNLSNVCPFGGKSMGKYADIVHFELVYLQHGILHASLLNMYAKECCVIDRVVVSSSFEQKNFVEKYGYSSDDLICSGMPRYDFIDINGKKKNKILFSPSWRSNLIGALINNNRKTIPDVFLKSVFYKEIEAFINSPELIELLEKYDLQLDFKNHPIFNDYNELFHHASDRITVSSGDVKMDKYNLIITDYSSIVFDAVYLNCSILYFVPDYDMFIAGVSHNYRQLDLPLEDGFGPLSIDADSLMRELKKAVENDFRPEQLYEDRMRDFFLYKDKHCRDRLYDSLINE